MDFGVFVVVCGQAVEGVKSVQVGDRCECRGEIGDHIHGDVSCVAQGCGLRVGVGAACGICRSMAVRRRRVCRVRRHRALFRYARGD